MKRCALLSILMAMFFSSVAFSQEDGKDKAKPQKSAERQIRLRRMQLDTEEREMELNFRRQMQEIKLEEARAALEQKRDSQKHPSHFKGHHKCPKALVVICAIVNILLGVWVYKDIRSRNAGSGIWIVVVLLAGVFGVIPYAIVRLGDIRKAES